MGAYTAVIDLGSNTARMAIYFFHSRGIFYEIENRKRVLRLSSHLQRDQTIDSAGVRKTLECMRQFKEYCSSRDIQSIIGVATAAVRQAVNGSDLLKKIEDETGIAFRMLSGEEEAYYGYLGVMNSMSLSNAVSVDIGGGSTEVSLIQNRKQTAAFSFPFGAVTLTQQFIRSDPPAIHMVTELKRFLSDQFSTLPWLQQAQFPLVAIGGAARNAAKIHQKQVRYPFPSLHHYVLQASDIDVMYHQLSRLSIKERKEINGLSKDRADIILAGIIVFHSLMEVTQSKQFISSNKGLRDGILFERILPAHPPIMDDVSAYGIEQFIHRYQVNESQAEQVCDTATEVFDQLHQLNIHTYGLDVRKLLAAACKLHDIGRSINMHESSQHTFYLLTNVLLLGFTHRERLLLAAIASYKTKKLYSKMMMPFKSMLTENDEKMILQLGSLVHFARTLERSITKRIKSIQLVKKKKQLFIECQTAGPNLIEAESLQEATDALSKAFHQKIMLELKF